MGREYSHADRAANFMEIKSLLLDVCVYIHPQRSRHYCLAGSVNQLERQITLPRSSCRHTLETSDIRHITTILDDQHRSLASCTIDVKLDILRQSRGSSNGDVGKRNAIFKRTGDLGRQGVVREGNLFEQNRQHRQGSHEEAHLPQHSWLRSAQY